MTVDYKPVPPKIITRLGVIIFPIVENSVLGLLVWDFFDVKTMFFHQL